MSPLSELTAQADAVSERLREGLLDDDERILIVKAPPGAGKTASR